MVGRDAALDIDALTTRQTGTAITASPRKQKWGPTSRPARANRNGGRHCCQPPLRRDVSVRCSPVQRRSLRNARSDDPVDPAQASLRVSEGLSGGPCEPLTVPDPSCRRHDCILADTILSVMRFVPALPNRLARLVDQISPKRSPVFHANRRWSGGFSPRPLHPFDVALAGRNRFGVGFGLRNPVLPCVSAWHEPLLSSPRPFLEPSRFPPPP